MSMLNILVSVYHLIYFCAGGAVQRTLMVFFTRIFYRFLSIPIKEYVRTNPSCWNIKRVLPVQSCNGLLFVELRIVIVSPGKGLNVRSRPNR